MPPAITEEAANRTKRDKMADNLFIIHLPDMSIEMMLLKAKGADLLEIDSMRMQSRIVF